MTLILILPLILPLILTLALTMTLTLIVTLILTLTLTMTLTMTLTLIVTMTLTVRTVQSVAAEQSFLLRWKGVIPREEIYHGAQLDVHNPDGLHLGQRTVLDALHKPS